MVPYAFVSLYAKFVHSFCFTVVSKRIKRSIDAEASGQSAEMHTLFVSDMTHLQYELSKASPKVSFSILLFAAPPFSQGRCGRRKTFFIEYAVLGQPREESHDTKLTPGGCGRRGGKVFVPQLEKVHLSQSFQVGVPMRLVDEQLLDKIDGDIVKSITEQNNLGRQEGYVDTSDPKEGGKQKLSYPSD